MGIIGWIILGGLAGWVASSLVDDEGRGLLMNIIIGIIGAFVGGLVFSALGGTGITGFNIWSFIVAIVGAIILLWIVNLFRRNRTRTTRVG